MKIRSILNGFTVLCLLLLSTTQVNAVSLEEKIIDRIDRSKLALEKTEAEIGADSRKLAQELSKRQSEVIELREKAADYQRLKDEQLLSLDTIKNRVEKWETQSAYQHHLLRAFGDAVNQQNNSNMSQDTLSSNNLISALDRLNQQLSPDWKSGNVIQESGEVDEAFILSIGPADIFYQSDVKQANALHRDPQNQPIVIEQFTKSQIAMTHDLYDQKQGQFVFDPSLGNAQKLNQENENIFVHIQKGGMWALPILFFGFLSLVITIVKGLHLWLQPKIDSDLYEKLQTGRNTNSSVDFDGESISEYASKLFKDENHPQFQLLSIALKNKVSGLRDELMLAFLREYRHRLERFTGVVATSAAVAPLLGLLGTVSGMISTFKLMTIFGSGDASTVSGGISEALVTTELGLIVAIPSLIVSALLIRKVKSYNQKLENFAIKLSKLEFK